jgi:hypothetical protein
MSNKSRGTSPWIPKTEQPQPCIPATFDEVITRICQESSKVSAATFEHHRPQRPASSEELRSSQIRQTGPRLR